MRIFSFIFIEIFLNFEFICSNIGTSPCFDQIEFITGAAYCFDMNSKPSGNPEDHALWPLYGGTDVALRMEMADSITFRAEIDLSGKEKFLF